MTQAMGTTVTNVVVTVNWKDEDLPFGQFDSATMGWTFVTSMVRSKDTTVDVVTHTGGESPDTLNITATSLQYNLAGTLQAMQKGGSLERCKVTITPTEDPNRSWVLERARCVSPMFRTNIDSTWSNDIYSIDFVGTWSKVSEGNYT